MNTHFYFLTIHSGETPVMRAPVPASAEPDVRHVDLHHEDCVRGMKRLESGSVEVIVTSPPYNIGVDYDGYEDERDLGSYYDWLRSALIECRRVLADDGSLFLNLGGPPSDPMKPFWTMEQCALQAGFSLQNVIHWVKAISLGDEPVRGHVKPVNSARFLNSQHEYVFHLTLTGAVPLDKLAVGVPYADTSNLSRGTRGKNGNVRDRGNVWYLPYDTIQTREKDRPHPATYPVALAERCIKLHGLSRARTVLDLFNGIGTTMIAAVRCGLNGIGFDVSLPYVEEAARRVEEEVRRNAGS